MSPDKSQYSLEGIVHLTLPEKEQIKAYITMHGHTLRDAYLTRHKDYPGSHALEQRNPYAMAHLAQELAQLDRDPFTYLSFADLVTETMNREKPDRRQRSRREHAQVIYNTLEDAQGTLIGTDGNVLLRADQLFPLANYHPSIGYYTGEHGIGRKDEKGNMESAFTTPLEDDPEYRESYARVVMLARERLEQQQKFTPEDPFQVYIAGDGEGRITQATVKALAESGTNPKNIEVTVLDLSANLLSRQRAGVSPETNIPVHYAPRDARHIDQLLPKKPSRGIIIAGEELIDVFPVHILQRSQQSGDIVEPAFRLSRDGRYQKVSLPLFTSPYKNAIEAYLHAFPHIQEYLTSGETAINLDLVRMIQRIAQTPFAGYWIGGDYTEYFHAKSHDTKPNLYNDSPVKAIPLHTPGSFVPIEEAVSSICDISCDLDPAALAFAEHMGMRPDFIGRMGHFMRLANGQPVLSKKEVLRQVQDNINALTRKFNPSVDYLRTIRDMQKPLFFRYLGSRINFAYAKGNVPPLFPGNELPW